MFMNCVIDRYDGLGLKVGPASVASQLLARVSRKVCNFSVN